MAVTAGLGPSVMLLHGVGLNADSWGGQIDTLANYFSVTALDMPGHGESPGLNLAKPDLSDYVAAMRYHLKSPTVIVGHSMGAMIGLKLAFDKKVLGVVSLNAVYQRSQSACDAVKKRAQELQITSIVDPKPTLERWFDDQTSVEALMCHKWLSDVSIDEYRAAYAVFSQENGPSAQELSELKKPALFMTGDREPNSTPNMSMQMAELCEFGDAIILEDAAHMMPMTHCKIVNKHLIDFISRCHMEMI